jgi:hypothetical protein
MSILKNKESINPKESRREIDLVPLETLKQYSQDNSLIYQERSKHDDYDDWKWKRYDS